MKKSTERKRIKRIKADSRMMFVNGLITANSLQSIYKLLNTAEKKLWWCENAITKRSEGIAQGLQDSED